MIPAAREIECELVRSYGEFFHVPALIRPEQGTTVIGYKDGNPLAEHPRARDSVRDLIEAAVSRGESNLIAAEFEQTVEIGRADHFGRPHVGQIATTEIGAETDRADDLGHLIDGVIDFCASLQFLDYAPCWGLVAPTFDPYLLISENNAFLFTSEAIGAGARWDDFEKIVFEPDSWLGADFDGLRSLIRDFDLIEDDQLTSMRRWETLPSPAALLRLREAVLLRPGVRPERLLDEAASRFV